MEPAERQNRIWNMNAHFVWSLASWGSAEFAQTASPILAAVGFYYSAFHAGYSAACTDAELPTNAFEQVKHGAVHGWIARILGDGTASHFRRLQHLRNSLNYLGAGDPINKFFLVQGRPVGLQLEGGGQMPFTEALTEANEISRSVIHAALAHIEQHCAAEGWPGPRRGNDSWQIDYLQDDVMLSVFSSDTARRDVLARGFRLLR